MSRTILETLAASKFVATLAQVEQLAALVATGNSANGTYLRVLLAGTQAALGRPQRGRQPNRASLLVRQEQTLTKVHAQYYEHVLAGVGGEGQERNRRANFARSAASTLRKAVNGGHDLRELDVATVSKVSIRKLTAPAEPADRVQRALQRSEHMLLRALDRMEPAQRMETVDRLVTQLDALAPQSEQPAVVGSRLQRVHRSERPHAQAGAGHH